MLTDKKLNREFEALRSLIQTAAKPFRDDPSTSGGRSVQKERIERAMRDMEYFGRTYFPHYITAPNSASIAIYVKDSLQ